MTDMVNHPPHYTHGPIECVRAIHAALGNRGFLAYLRGTIIKYSWRAEHKGATKEDMAKIGFYSNEAVMVAGAIEVEAEINPNAQQIKATILRAERESVLAGILATEPSTLVIFKTHPGPDHPDASTFHGLTKMVWDEDKLRAAATQAEQPLEADLGAMREALEHAAAQARKDHAEIERLENELRRFTIQMGHRATPAQQITAARQAMKEADFAAKGIVFAADGSAAADIVAIQNHAQGLICRIGRI